MDDLISREAAILELNHGVWGKEYDKTLAKTMLESLPSAQQEIIRCGDCKWFRKEYGWNCIEYTVCGISPTNHPIRREEDFCSLAERREDG